MDQPRSEYFEKAQTILDGDVTLVTAREVSTKVFIAGYH